MTLPLHTSAGTLVARSESSGEKLKQASEGFEDGKSPRRASCRGCCPGQGSFRPARHTGKTVQALLPQSAPVVRGPLPQIQVPPRRLVFQIAAKKRGSRHDRCPESRCRTHCGSRYIVDISEMPTSRCPWQLTVVARGTWRLRDSHDWLTAGHGAIRCGLIPTPILPVGYLPDWA